MRVHKSWVPRIGLAIATAGLIGGVTTAPSAQTVTAPALSLDIMHAQVILDRLGFSPGVIDGKEGQSLRLALRGFQERLGLRQTGELDQPTLAALARWRSIRPTRTLALSAGDVAGPYQGLLPRDPADQAKLPALGYANVVERLAERFHTTPRTLIALNPGARLAVGTRLVFPNAVPSSRDYPADLPQAWRATLSDLNVDARQPMGARIVVDKSEGVLKVFDDGGRLVGQFPATMGSGHDPLPIGSWKVQGMSYNPEFHYNPELFWDVSDNRKSQLLPPGPNSPVGVIWLDLNKPHYGIHGTPRPETIGRTESHGCIRLTNWDAARLSLMIRAGTPARFQE